MKILKKIAVVTGKILLLFIIWGTGLSIMVPLSHTIEKTGQPTAVFLFEFIPFLSLLAAQLILLRIFEKGRFSAIGLSSAKILGSSITGLFSGFAWMIVSLLGLFTFAKLEFNHSFTLSFFEIVTYFLILYINAATQEILVHGYTFFVIRRNFGSVKALLFTSVIFLGLHAAAFQSGFLSCLNIFGAGLFFGLLLVYSDNLWSPIAAHCIWNYLGAVWFGLIPISNYPTMQLFTLSGKEWIKGGENGMETGFIVTITMLICNTILILLLRKRFASRLIHSEQSNITD